MNTFYVVLVIDHSNYDGFIIIRFNITDLCGIEDNIYHPQNKNGLIPALIREVTFFSYS